MCIELYILDLCKHQYRLCPGKNVAQEHYRTEVEASKKCDLNSSTHSVQMNIKIDCSVREFRLAFPVMCTKIRESGQTCLKQIFKYTTHALLQGLEHFNNLNSKARGMFNHIFNTCACSDPFSDITFWTKRTHLSTVQLHEYVYYSMAFTKACRISVIL